jgi:Dolichyl-phosphate-mannose-protein mannosyltransferase
MFRASPAAAIITAALAISVVIRVLLALVNLEANDPHLPVIGAIAFKHHFPTREEAWEGFQPKLYHSAAALVWRVLPTSDIYALTRAAQLVSGVAGIMTLFVVLRFLHRACKEAQTQPVAAERAAGAALSDVPPVSPFAWAIAFAAVALNPALAGTSVQATNDAFVILFATLMLYSGLRFLSGALWRDFIALVLWAILAGLSKGNGLVAIAAVAVTFAIVALIDTRGVRRRRIVLAGAVFVALVVPAVALIGPYYSYYRQYGTPFVTNWPRAPRPDLRYETFVGRPGLTSVVHGLLTFRLLDLLRHPESNDDPEHYPRHRTSLWSRLHAQAHSAHFENWPPSWGARDPQLAYLTRALIVLGLVPTALLVWGLAAMVREAVLGWWLNQKGTESHDALADAWPATLLLLVTAVGYLAFAALYAVKLRDYSSMKVIFVLPALLALVVALELGIERLLAWGLSRRTRVAWYPRRVVVGAIGLAVALLFAGYVADLGVLAMQLADDRAAGVRPFCVPTAAPRREPGQGTPRSEWVARYHASWGSSPDCTKPF